eukprot:gene1996-2318_t
MNLITGACRKLIVFHVQLRIRTTSGVRCNRAARNGADWGLTTRMNLVPGVEDRSLRVDRRGCGTDSNAPGIFTGRCSRGACTGLLPNIRQATQGTTEPVVFTALFPPNPGAAVFVRSATTSGAVGTRQWGQLWDDGKPEHYDVIAGDGVYTNTLNITFDTVGVNNFVAVMPIGNNLTRVTPQLVSITVFSARSLPTPGVENATMTMIANWQRQVNDLVDRGATPKTAIDRVLDLMRGVRAASAESIESEANWGMDVPLAESELALASSEASAAAAVDPQAVSIIKESIVRVSDRRIEFRTTEGLPGVVMATNGLDRKICMVFDSQEGGQPSPLRRLLDEEDHLGEGEDAGGWQQQQRQRSSPGLEQQYGAYSRYFTPSRKLLQPAQALCPFSRGKVLILSPFIANFACFFVGSRYYKDEVRQVSPLYRQAGYDVTFKCNNPVPCRRGRPLLTDFTAWSGYAAVLLSSLGDSNNAGTNPIILTRARLPPPTGSASVSSFAADWRSGRIMLHGQDGFALTPAWFQKYGYDTRVNATGTVLYFSVDRSGRGAYPPLAYTMQAAVPGSVGFAAYTDFISRKFDAPRPGMVMTNWLLSNKGTVADYPCENATDTITGARFRSWAYNSTSTLPDARNKQIYDRCRYNCNGLDCGAVSCPGSSQQGFCNALTRTCDVSCNPNCNKVDGDACSVRGLLSTCKDGVCQAAASDSPVANRLLVEPQADAAAIAAAITRVDGRELIPAKDGTICQYYGTQLGSCQRGVCIAAPVCNYFLPTVVVSGTNVVVWGDGRGGDTFWTSAPSNERPDCPDTATLQMYPIPEDCRLANASLVVRSVTGLYFLNCWSYEGAGTPTINDFPTVGPALQFEPVEQYGPDRIINLRAVIFGYVFQGVEDCWNLLTLTITNSLGTFVIPDLPCMPQEGITYPFPSANGDPNEYGRVPIPQGERSTIRFGGFDSAHILSIKGFNYTGVLQGPWVARGNVRIQVMMVGLLHWVAVSGVAAGRGTQCEMANPSDSAALIAKLIMQAVVFYVGPPGHILWHIKWPLLMNMTIAVLLIVCQVLQDQGHFDMLPDVDAASVYNNFRLISFVLALLLTFRLNRSYERWWLARLSFGGVASACVTLSMQAVQWIPDAALKGEIMRWCKLWHYSVLQVVRDDKALDPAAAAWLTEEELHAYNAHRRATNLVAVNLRFLIDLAPVGDVQAGEARQEMEQVVQAGRFAVGNCRRLKTQCMPYAISLMCTGFVQIFLLLSPFGIINMRVISKSGLNPLLNLIIYFITCVLVLGVDEVASKLEQPFPYLPLVELVDTTVGDIDRLSNDLETWRPLHLKALERRRANQGSTAAVMAGLRAAAAVESVVTVVGEDVTGTK